MPPQASFVLFERSGGRARRPWRTSACFLLPTGSRPGIGTYARNAMTCRRGSRLGRELARWRTVGENGLRSLPNRDLTGLLTGLEDQAVGMISQLRWVLPRCWHDSILSKEAESLQETQSGSVFISHDLPSGSEASRSHDAEFDFQSISSVQIARRGRDSKSRHASADSAAHTVGHACSENS